MKVESAGGDLSLSLRAGGCAEHLSGKLDAVSGVVSGDSESNRIQKSGVRVVIWRVLEDLWANW